MLALRGRSFGLCLAAAALIAPSAPGDDTRRRRHRLERPRRECACRHGRPVADRLDGSSRDGPRRRLRRRELGRQAVRALPGAGAGASTGTQRTPRRQRPPIASCSPSCQASRRRSGRCTRPRSPRSRPAGQRRAASPSAEIAAAAMLAARTGDGRGGAYRFPAPATPEEPWPVGRWRPVLPSFGNDPAAWIKDVQPFLIRDPARYATKPPRTRSRASSTRASSTR